MDRIDLEELERVADYYEKRKQTMIELGALKDPAYLATLAEGEAVKAFEALRPLIERVRELERQRDKLLGMYCNEMVCSWCWLDEVCPHFDETIVRRNPNSEGCRETLRKWLEEAAKEAGDETSNR